MMTGDCRLTFAFRDFSETFCAGFFTSRSSEPPPAWHDGDSATAKANRKTAAIHFIFMPDYTAFGGPVDLFNRQEHFRQTGSGCASVRQLAWVGKLVWGLTSPEAAVGQQLDE